MHENRETWGASPARGDRSGKVNSHKPDRCAPEESHDAIVPMKPPNKEAQASAEVVEGRAFGRGEHPLLRTCVTQCGGPRVFQGDRDVRPADFPPTATIQDRSRMRYVEKSKMWPRGLKPLVSSGLTLKFAT